MSTATSNTGDPNSFGYSAARKRWRRILVSAIDEIRSTTQEIGLGKDDVEAGLKIVSQIESLISSMLSDAVLDPVPKDGGPDVDDYNSELDTPKEKSWLNSPWLYTACYLYRITQTFFSMSIPAWQSFDVFESSKRQALAGNKKGTVELVKRFEAVIKAENKDVVDEALQKAIFEEMVQICLWGNATDLGLLTSGSVEEFDSRQGKAVRERAPRQKHSRMIQSKSGNCCPSSRLQALLKPSTSY